MNEQFELYLIQRQLKIEILINKIQQTIYEIPKKKELIIKHLTLLYNVISKAIDGNIQAIKYINSLYNNEAYENNLLLYPQKYIDDLGNIYEVRGINESTLNYQWRKFDLKYTGSLSLGFYLKALNEYIRNTCGIKSFKIKLIKKGKKLII